MPRQNTRLEAEGAEFLVLGQLLIEALPTYKMYTNMPGYDLLVVNPEEHQVARVSVKSRWKKSANGFIINNFDSDFVVVTKLNKGVADRVAPQFFVVPTEILRPLSRPGWGKLNFTTIPRFHSYENAWHLIREFIRMAPASEPLEDEDAADL